MTHYRNKRFGQSTPVLSDFILRGMCQSWVKKDSPDREKSPKGSLATDNFFFFLIKEEPFLVMVAEAPGVKASGVGMKAKRARAKDRCIKNR